MEVLPEQWKPPPIPSWSAVGIIVLISTPVLLASYMMGGSGAVMAASGGLTFAAYTMTATGLRSGLPRLVVGALAALVASQFAAPWPVTITLLVLAALAGAELARFGTRCLVASIYGCLAILVGLSRDANGVIWLAYLAGMIAGCGAIGIAGLADILPRSVGGGGAGSAMFVFLTVGLVISSTLVGLLDHPRSYWISFLFVMRAIVPLEMQKNSIGGFGVGASLGVVSAVLVEWAHPPLPIQLLIAFTAAVVGLRYAAHPLPVTSAAFTGAILLGSARTFPDAMYRAEAIFVVMTVVVLLVLVLDRLWVLFSKLDTGAASH